MSSSGSSWMNWSCFCGTFYMNNSNISGKEWIILAGQPSPLWCRSSTPLFCQFPTAWIFIIWPATTTSLSQTLIYHRALISVWGTITFTQDWCQIICLWGTFTGQCNMTSKFNLSYLFARLAALWLSYSRKQKPLQNIRNQIWFSSQNNVQMTQEGWL